MYLTLYDFLLLFIYSRPGASCIQSMFFQLLNLLTPTKKALSHSPQGFFFRISITTSPCGTRSENNYPPRAGL